MKFIIQFITLISLSLFLKNESFAQDFNWAKGIGGIGVDLAYDIEIDAQGNSYTIGGFSDTVDFDPGVGVFNLVSSGGRDAFILKLDAAGNFVWAKNIGGTSSATFEALTIDNSGNFYLCGSYSGTADFNPGAAIFSQTSRGSHDGFVLKLNASANFVWVKTFRGASPVQALSVAVDNSGNVYSTGYFSGRVDFDPGTAVFDIRVSSTNEDVFISKLDASGNFIWAKNIGGPNDDKAETILIDNNDNIYLLGRYQFTGDFDPNNGVYNLTSNGNIDVFISSLDTQGNFRWAKSIGSSGVEVGNSMTFDDLENLLIAGDFSGTIDFDPGANISNRTAIGTQDIFIMKLQNSGSFDWSLQMGGTDAASARDIFVDNFKNIYTTGFFYGTIDFDPDTSIYNLSTNFPIYTNGNTYVSKLDSAGKFIWAEKMESANDASAGEALTVDANGNVYSTGGFWGVNDFNPDTTVVYPLTSVGSRDIYISKLGSLCNTADTINPIACNNYLSPSGNRTWSTNGTYFDIIPNAEGCDSLLTINLTINNKSTSSISPIVCDSFVSPSTNYTYIQSGVYRDTLVNTSGCDSIVTINLTVDSINLSVTNNSPNLSSDELGATYQWLDCNNTFAAISGATNQNYSALINGSYAVELTKNNCIDTSACVQVINVGLAENTVDFGLNYYPNPTKGRFTINLKSSFDRVEVRILNILEQEINQSVHANTNQLELFIEGPSGLYLVELKTSNGFSVLKIIKE